jgi:XRE family transcriptional regulator, fatty acid utilization regulator
MGTSSENLRFILGLKVKTLRQSAGYSLKQLAAASGLSISYLSEIEKGKKYPKPEKMLGLATALGVSYDDLVSARVQENLNPVTETLQSAFFSEFPFEVFGLRTQDLFSLFSEDPSRAGALVRTFLEIGQMYDMRVEHFLFAALRSYQLMHDNYFVDIEEAAAAFRDQVGTKELKLDASGALQRTLERIHGYTIDASGLTGHPEIRDLRSVLALGPPPTLFVNEHLLPAQRAFVFGRELAYHVMGLGERATTSSWLKVTSFEQVLNNFKASYFAGAVLIDRDELLDAMTRFFASTSWSPEAFMELMARFSATPEMFFYRLGQLLPGLLGLQEFFFLRLNHDARSGSTQLTKVFNRSELTLPQGFWLDEHYCRRWGGMRLLFELPPNDRRTQIRVQRSVFQPDGQEFLVFSLARPLQLSSVAYSCVNLGFRINDALRKVVGFVDDPSISTEWVNVTCERCALGAAECADRAAEGTLHASSSRLERKEAAIAELIASAEPGDRVL